MLEQQSSYRQIMKATSLFGGAQIFIILIGLVRSKVIAAWLGVNGFGVFSLLNTPLQLIATITGLGITFSAVRDIAIANEHGDVTKIRRTHSVLNKWLWIIGFLGVSVTILLSPFLSFWSFGNYSYTSTFLFLSLTLIIQSFSNGQGAYLRGTRNLAATAKSSILGPLLGLMLSIPLYYWGGISAISPAIVLSALATLLASWVFYKKVKPQPIKLSFKKIFFEGQDMVRLGIVMTMSGLLSQLAGYLIIVFIGQYGGVKEVGLYNAGFIMTNQYVSVIFSAILIDYFPRLAAMSSDNLKLSNEINQQGEITILLLGPILILFIILLPFIIKILFTSDFLPIIHFVRLMAVGMIFRAASWVISVVPGAKGDNKFFLTIEAIGCSVYLLASYIGYVFNGLEGLGYAFIVTYILYWCIVYIAAKYRYEYSMSKEFLMVFLPQVLLVSITIFAVDHWNSFLIWLFLLLLSLTLSLYSLNRKVNFIEIIYRWVKK